mmetsp:Transcript_24662/g.61708  ORF Transcript_24662/g.61708 Transcript_24662/m.61708 type:complete len:201 (-) Transcript_24662:145-747(-)
MRKPASCKRRSQAAALLALVLSLGDSKQASTTLHTAVSGRVLPGGTTAPELPPLPSAATLERDRNNAVKPTSAWVTAPVLHDCTTASTKRLSTGELFHVEEGSWLRALPALRVGQLVLPPLSMSFWGFRIPRGFLLLEERYAPTKKAPKVVNSATKVLSSWNHIASIMRRITQPNAAMRTILHHEKPRPRVESSLPKLTK